jgi:adenosylhomocysteine nucleosidase
MRLLVVASDRMEFTGLLSRAAVEETPRLRLDWARWVRLGEHQALLAANGVGAERAAAAVDAALEAFDAEAVVSAGFCGALDPALAVADIVAGTCILTWRTLQRAALAVVPAGGAVHCGTICSLDHVARTAAEKRMLFTAGAIAVEMEAAGVAQRAQERGLPCYCIRTVTDLAGETMANDFNAALRSDGHFDTMKLLGKLFGSPWDRLPELVRLRRRCALASHTLGDFIADCRF